MQTVVQSDEMPPADYVDSIGRETDGGAIAGVLWSLAIMAPVYAAIVWIVMAYWSS